MRKYILKIKSKIWSGLCIYIKLGVILMMIASISMASGSLLSWLVIFRVEHYQQGKMVLFTTMYGGVINLVSAIGTLVLLDICFFKRIYNLNREIRKIEYGKDLAARLTVTGNDEISLLTRTINNILEYASQWQSGEKSKE
ncbi:MAG: hypothetical protein JW770_05915 [Actinobacteria bacterium]|nr:hypothetical protein [Actinomycetota bacterium]